jgi:HAD superfamily hydrolase (TIGR01509 family)
MARAFLFDMDGVVVDSTQLHVECWLLYLQQHGISADQLGEKMLGRRNDELVPVLFGEGLSDRQIAAHGAAKEALYRDLLAPKLQESLVPGIGAFLRHWDAVPKALATNAEPANVDFILDGAGLRKYFGAIVDGHQVERPKPAPDIYVRAAEILGVQPEECVVFEDSPTGVEAARLAGAKVVGLTTTVPRLEGVDLTIRDFEDPRLEQWLDSFEYAG